MNFITLCLSGDVLADEIDHFVDKWHDDEGEQNQTLHEFLGMTWEEYSLWATKPSILPFILSAYRNNSHIDTELNLEKLALAARAETTEEADKMVTWLKSIGKL